MLDRINGQIVVGFCLFEIWQLAFVTPAWISNGLGPGVVVDGTSACPSAIVGGRSSRKGFSCWSVAFPIVEVFLGDCGICPVDTRNSEVSMG
jgi:hypothetical protein